MLGSGRHILLALLVSFVLILSEYLANAQTIYPAEAILDTTLLELPSLTQDNHLIIHEGYISCFDEKTLSPRWVAYELTAAELDSIATQREGSFKKDPSFPGRQASNQDYAKSGYDKGHIAPAADFKWSLKAMAQSFYFTNISPQTPALNRRHWLKTEEIARAAARNHGHVWIISGPIFQDTDKEPDAGFKSIGKNEVTVPGSFFKALLTIDKEGKYNSIAFILRNDASSQTPHESFITVDSLETVLKVDLFKALGEDKAAAAESCAELNRWTNPEFKQETQSVRR